MRGRKHCWSIYCYNWEYHQLVDSSDKETSARFLLILVSLYLAPLACLLYDCVSCLAGWSVMRSTTPTAGPCTCALRSEYVHVSLIFVGGNFCELPSWPRKERKLAPHENYLPYGITVQPWYNCPNCRITARAGKLYWLLQCIGGMPWPPILGHLCVHIREGA